MDPPEEVTDAARLRRNYDGAIRSLLRSERIIGYLHEELKSRDERIVSLEARIVEMSLELASSKALEDEHRLYKRRMSGGSLNNNESFTTVSTAFSSSHSSTDSDKVMPPPPHQRQVNQEEERPVMECLKDGSGVKPLRAERLALSRSWTALGLTPRGAEGLAVIRSHPAISEGNMDCGNPKMEAVPNDADGPTRFDLSSRSGSKGNLAALALESLARTKKDRGATLSLDFPTTMRRKSAPSRSISVSNIGQILLGLSKADLEDEDVGEDKCHGVDSEKRQKGDSVSSCESVLSRVVFPVSFEDCLAGLEGSGGEGSPST